MATKLKEFLPTRKSLLTRLKNWDDQEGWREFFESYWRLIYGVALKAGFSDAEAQDVVQETIISVAKKMKRFKYDPSIGSFKAWLLLVTRSRIADRLRKRHKPLDQAVGDLIDEAQDIADPAPADFETVWEEEWKRNLFSAALEKVKQQVNAKHYLIFDLYALKEQPLHKVTRSLGVNTAQVYMAKYRISRLLQSEIKRLERGLR